MSRSLLSVSLDLDNKWSYMKTHGDPGWDAFPSYFDSVEEIILPAVAQASLRITFFVVGQDAALERNHRALHAIHAAGHEIGNHSFSHEPWFHEYTAEQTRDEICRAEEAIQRAVGVQPRGFRGPGFSLTRQSLEVLAARGYAYDASTFPTFVGPLARAYYFCKSRGLDRAERARRSRLFGTWREGLRPLRPYRWRTDERSIVELPVTTFPIFRTPIHLSYLLYLSLRSRRVARLYLRSAMAACRLRGVQPSFLLHPLDFLGGDCVKGLEFFPAMGMTTAEKLALFRDVVGILRSRFTLVNMETHAGAVAAATRSPMRDLGSVPSGARP